MTYRLLLLLPLISLLTGCGAMKTVGSWFASEDKTVDPPAPLVEFQASIKIKELWSRDTGSGTDDQYLELMPEVAGDRVYAVDSDGDLVAMNASKGRKIWSRDVDARITGGVGFGVDTVLLGTGEGEIIACNAANGKVLWRTRVSSEILSPPQRAGDTVVVRTIDGKLFGIDAASGSRTWVYDRTVPSLTLRGTSTPIIDGDVVVAGFDGGRIAALDIGSGRLLWETRVAVGSGHSELEQLVDIDSEPVVKDGVIYVVTFQGQLAALELSSGRLLWSGELSSYAGLSVDDGNVYVTDEDSHVKAYDRYSGSLLWEQDKLHARFATGPASIGDYVVVGDMEGYLHWMNKNDGSFAARNRVSNDRLIAKPTVVDNILYAYSTDGTLAAYSYQ